MKMERFIYIKICDKKWMKVNDLSSGQCSASRKIRFENSQPRSNLCDYSDSYIVVKGRVSVRRTNDSNKRNRKLTFKNNDPFRSRISKINNTFKDNIEDYANL